jgi:hypothetical protein
MFITLITLILIMATDMKTESFKNNKLVNFAALMFPLAYLSIMTLGSYNGYRQEKDFLAKESVTIEGNVLEYSPVEPKGEGPLKNFATKYSFSLPGDSVEDVFKTPITVQVEDSYDGEKVTKEDVGAWVQQDTCVNVQAREVSDGIYKALAHQVKPCKDSLDDKL